MTSPQTENGFTRIANEILEAVQSFRFTQNQFKLLLALWRNTYGWNRKECEFSLNQIIKQTGLQRKRVIDTLQSLEENNVIIEVKPPRGSSPKVVKFNKNYMTWTVKKYAGMEFSSGHSDTPKPKEIESSSGHSDTPSKHLGVVEMTPPTSSQSDPPLVVMPTPLSSGHGDTSRVGQNDTPIKKKEILKKINIKTGDVDVENKNEIPVEEYKRKLIKRFVELRGHGFYPKPADVSAAEEIQKAGVPLNVAISTMEDVFGNYNPKHSLDRINSLRYCAAAILTQHYENTIKTAPPVYEEVKAIGQSSESHEQNTSKLGDVQLFR